MAEEAVYSQKTFGQVSDNLGTLENKPPVDNGQSPADIQIPDDVIPPVDNQPSADGQPAADPSAPPADAIVDSPEFKISFGDEPPQDGGTPTDKPIPQTYNWKDEIKKIDKKELLKELGVNEFAVEIDEHLAKGGKAADYLNAKSIDYNQISDETLVKEDLRNQFKGFSKEEIDRLFLTKYPNLNSDLDEEKEDAELKLRADAYLNRQSKIEQQQKFKIPETPILHTDAAYEQWKQEEQSRPQLVEKVKNYFLTHDATKTLNESKRVTISLGEGVQPFSFNIDKPELITRSLTDGGEIMNKLTSTATGEPDVLKQQQIALFSFDPNQYNRNLFNYGVSMGKKMLVEEGQNAQKPQAKIASMPNNEGQTVTTKKFGQLAQ